MIHNTHVYDPTITIQKEFVNTNKSFMTFCIEYTSRKLKKVLDILGLANKVARATKRHFK